MEVHKLSHIICPISVGINGLAIVKRARQRSNSSFCLSYKGEGGGGGEGGVRLVAKLVWILVIN